MIDYKTTISLSCHNQIRLRPFVFFVMIMAMLCCQMPSLLSTASADTNLTADHEKIIKNIVTLGGTVIPTPGDNLQHEVMFHIKGQDLTDEHLQQITALPTIVSLNLQGTKITSAGLVHLQKLKHLRRLHLETTQIDDNAALHLKVLNNLEYLNLYKTNITDKTLQQLVSLAKLKKLFVWQTGVTDKGITQLQAALPNLKIARGIDMSKPLPPGLFAKPDKTNSMLKWIATNKRTDAPKSHTGSNIHITFENKSGKHVKIYWVGYDNKLRLYGELRANETRQQNSYSQNTWLITDANDQPLGYFISDAQIMSWAVIPKK
jgi:hypothetical protein